MRAWLPCLVLLAACGGNLDAASSSSSSPPTVVPQASCDGVAAPGPLARIDGDVEHAERGACGRVAYVKSDGSLWLHEPGAPPLHLADDAHDPHLDATGKKLLYTTPQGPVLYDLAAHRAADVVLPGATPGAPTKPMASGFVYDGASPIAFVVVAGGVLRVADDGTLTSAAAFDVAAFVATARGASIVVVTRAADHRIVAVDVAHARVVTSSVEQPDVGDHDREDRAWLSVDGKVLVHQPDTLVLQGDVGGPQPGAAEVVSTETGAVIGGLGTFDAASLLEATDTGHVFAAPAANGGYAFVDPGDRLAVHSVDGRELTALLGDGTAIASAAASGSANDAYHLVSPTGGDEPLLASDSRPVASRHGAFFAASRLSDRCIHATDDPTTCNTQLWQLVRKPRGGAEQVLAWATQPVVIDEVGDDGTLVVDGDVLDGDPPADAASTVDPGWRTFGVDVSGKLRPVASMPALEGVAGAVVAFGGDPSPVLATVRSGQEVTVYALDPARGVARELLSGTGNLVVDADTSSRAVVVLSGPGPNELWAGIPTPP